LKTAIPIFVAALTLSALPVRAEDTDAVTKAQTAAKTWLTLTDAGKYDRSWDSAASLFKSSITKSDWEKTIRSVRSPLGALKSRTVKSATFTRTLPGAPDGEYVVIQFDTKFANKASAVETVTPMHEKDGSWRVAGYYIK
jgi:hypothetical protein